MGVGWGNDLTESVEKMDPLTVERRRNLSHGLHHGRSDPGWMEDQFETPRGKSGPGAKTGFFSRKNTR